MKSNQLEIIWRTLRRNKGALCGAIVVLFFIFLGILAPLIAPYDPIKMDLEHRLEPPSVLSIMGRDQLGRDIFSRIVYGARITLIIGVAVVAIASVIGSLLGLTAGYCGGLVDEIIMRIIDIMMAFPGILLAIAIASALGPGLNNISIALGVSFVPPFARVTRGKVLSVKEEMYVEAARATGEGELSLAFRHVLPNCLAPIVVLINLRMGISILYASGLSFLGLGVQPPIPEWGAMLSAGRDYLRTAPHIAVFPGLAILFTVLGFNLLGDGLRDTLDPRLRVD